MSTVRSIKRDCVIAGGGPAGMVLGYLLARAGLQVTVLEKHADFLRDFRGDTIHPSTITLLRELGLVERFLDLPLTRISTMDAVFDGERFTIADFGTLPAPDNFLVFAPQWDFLNFLAAEASALPGFELRMSTRADEVLYDGGRVAGVRATDPDGGLDVRAPLTVAADGRGSVLRNDAGLYPTGSGVPIDVLWFHLPKPRDPRPPTLGYVSGKGMVLTLDRGSYYQSGMIIRKDSFETIKAEGLAAFRARIAAAAPHLAVPAESIVGWDQIKLLSVKINRLKVWHRPGFIAIGDAAHAMSPMFGVGVNYAIQDAVALANAVAPGLARGEVRDDTLAAVQKRREVPVRKMQRIQRLGHRAIARRPGRRAFVPRPAKWVLRTFAPRIRRAAARFIGIGFRPEHPQIF
ncbi:monooxygenase FAD-binding [Pseudarthrobacter chlorophenolicus A6]|uniref:Monooxygenase FAD-binding n=1 Tax=Pseudarthrobacter chlorophenolicus (strain ATCC 700700 / DSM 12829 / CIP 107037 / JCM 12360 / KCTC 9906 / NCIMB 13794 / A6) TaxID=452863 RepID=B8HDU5_PSECP|nr:FAD-dependent oxidoreductase [Pseudarthrobacter chlorophenolicus]ACL40813.1 monooxygenase FAD-binding [Pseudarthrobacter chlorophenolicus A6]SDQ74625.1 2-polyprenyl-6-methoxyphenol hydroxylase [Pseudarthrobacter chlorophenolicus]